MMATLLLIARQVKAKVKYSLQAKSCLSQMRSKQSYCTRSLVFLQNMDDQNINESQIIRQILDRQMSEEELNPPQQRITYKSKARISFIVLNIALSSFYFGYCLAFLGQISTDRLKEIFGIELSNSVTEGILNGCVPVGAFFGAFFSSILISKFSRRKCLLIVNCFSFIVGCLIYVQYFPVLVFCRFCQGLSVGFFSTIVPLIIKELSPIQISGTLGSYGQLNLTSGIFISCILSYGLSKIMSDQYSWYVLFGVPQLTVIIQTLVLIFVFPYETPKYWLSIRGSMPLYLQNGY